MSKSYFFLGYIEYFKPWPVECLNKLWHWAILTVFSNHWLHIDVPCVWGEGFPLNAPWPESSTGGQKISFLGRKQYSSGVVGTKTVVKEMKYVEDLNRTLVNPRPKGVENTTQSASVKCLTNSNLMYCWRVKQDKLWINSNCWPLPTAENKIQ